MDDQMNLFGEPESAAVTDVPKKQRKPRIKTEPLGEDSLKAKPLPKPPKVKKDRSKQAMFRELLGKLNLEEVKKPWMATKSFRLIDSDDELGRWVDQQFLDGPFHVVIPGTAPTLVCAIDTETTGLDTRVLIDLKVEKGPNGEEQWTPLFEVNIELAGVCLSVDGIHGVYVPLFHENAPNCTREGVHQHLQRLFDRSHLVFYNAKFDREVLRLTAAIEFRDYPHYEDVQSLYFNVDPKASLEDDTFSAASGGLKALTKQYLGYEQISLDTLTKVSATWCPKTQSGNCHCNEEELKALKHTRRMQHVPFTWVPPNIAVWYAAADAITTWLLWSRFHEEALTRRLVHRIDGCLTDSLTWIERQRFVIATDALRRTTAWHRHEIETRRARLRELAVKGGWPEETDETTGLVKPETIFDVDKKHLGRFLYDIRKFEVTKRTATGEPSCDKEALADLIKRYPEDEFLKALKHYKKIVALHPGHLRYDERDKTARIYLKQSTVAGGRLAATGGNFDRDGGFGLNIQAIKKIEDRWLVEGKVLEPDYVAPEDVEPHEESELDPSCFQEGKPAPGIINNHIANYLGYAICLVPTCTTCAKKFGILIEHGRLDARQMINLRALFGAPEGWTFFSSDWSNIEMRVAANQSLEPAFIKEFLEGEGDFHALTARNVFPEFSMPSTPKGVRKMLRGLAKIMNFALLYGGTAFTIYKNLRTKKPDLTFEDAVELVKAYCRGVPVFKKFCDEKQRIAREQLICETDTGRLIKFASAMKAEKIRVPTAEEEKACKQYYVVRKKMKQFRADGEEAKALEMEQFLDTQYRDPTTGIRNAIAYRRFMGKIERVSVNVPLQGLAGDLMRMAINNIREWATRHDPLVQAVLRLHGSVHDELDYAVKNPYVPFVVPRITRLMKLRRLHQAKQWPVPIEADTEYGGSWDVVHHLTGDSDHMAAGWTEIEGMEHYLPDGITREYVDAVAEAIATGSDVTRSNIMVELHGVLHNRAIDALHLAFEQKDKKTGEIIKVQDCNVIRRQITIAFQLDEYWRIDETPDDAAPGTLETLEHYEVRCGLTQKDRGFLPPGGFLATLPLTGVKRPAPEPLDPKGPDMPSDPGSGGGEPSGPPSPEPVAAPVTPFPALTDAVAVMTPPNPPSSLKDLGKVVAINRPTVPLVAPVCEPTHFVLRPDITQHEMSLLMARWMPGHGNNSMTVVYRGIPYLLERLRIASVPAEYLADGEQHYG